MAKRKLVIVEWRDSMGSTNAWEERQGLEKLPPARCTTVGFVLEDAEDYLTVAATISDSHLMGRLTIPKEAISTISACRRMPARRLHKTARRRRSAAPRRP